MNPVPLFASLDIPTSDGVFVATYSERGLCCLNFPSGTMTAPRTPGVLAERALDWHTLTVKALKRALSGKAPGKLPPLDLSSGTAFQQQVWRALLHTGTGRTKTYGEIARSLRKPGATRAVGSACGANSIPVLIPCHRVVASGGKLGGFSAELNWKRTLLAREGARFWE